MAEGGQWKGRQVNEGGAVVLVVPSRCWVVVLPQRQRMSQHLLGTTPVCVGCRS